MQTQGTNKAKIAKRVIEVLDFFGDVAVDCGGDDTGVVDPGPILIDRAQCGFIAVEMKRMNPTSTTIPN